MLEFFKSGLLGILFVGMFFLGAALVTLFFVLLFAVLSALSAHIGLIEKQTAYDLGDWAIFISQLCGVGFVIGVMFHAERA